LLELVYYTSNNFLGTSSSFNWTLSLVISSLFSLLIGTILGLTQFRIKRLFAYSTISHVGFILLALSISSIESTQAFIFYLIQYSISNLNAFIILITIGFSLYYLINEEYDASKDAGSAEYTENKELLDKNNSPIQLVNQLRGYFYINPLLALSLAITIFSFAGIPPLVGFFAKQMVLSAALDNGFFFLSLVAILTSVIGAVYYLNVIKEIFFFLPQYKLNPLLNNFNLNNIYTASFSSDTNSKENNFIKSITLKYNNVVMASSISITISTITLVVLLFIFMNKE
jgi:NADH-ubiquinone oxidoreductase chain 2